MKPNCERTGALQKKWVGINWCDATTTNTLRKWNRKSWYIGIHTTHSNISSPILQSKLISTNCACIADILVSMYYTLCICITVWAACGRLALLYGYNIQIAIMKLIIIYLINDFEHVICTCGCRDGHTAHAFLLPLEVCGLGIRIYMRILCYRP